ncbi:MAG: Decarbamoylnovobiocin carbamoyltransferase [Alphaproteobacteria bacterium MarineAlpha3_Bin7]|nr:MAG: Decarbamoylnovobiocin carbamoyltransferase [Alphaproteobacteria bacterium MarineAlpha3_Bin7]
MDILGISGYYHDSSAALVRDGKIIAAAQEERFSREKGDSSFPKHAIKFCLQQANTDLNEISQVAFYDKPLLTFDRLLETYFAYAPKGFSSFVKSIPLWVKQKLLLQTQLVKELNALKSGTIEPSKLSFSHHHHSHAASAFFPSPFDSSAILIMDGVGEWATTSLGRGNKDSLILDQEIKFPHSIGLLYSAFTYYLGFKVNEGEYKVMGLAPFGEPCFVDKIKDEVIDIKEDGSFRLNMRYFDYCTSLTMTNREFSNLFGNRPPRKPDTPLQEMDMNIARSIQVITEEVVLKLAKTLRKKTGEKNLVMAGGVALNCVANGLLVKEKVFDNLWVQPAAGDAGGSIGAALAASSISGTIAKKDEKFDGMSGCYLGPSYEDAEIKEVLERYNADYDLLDIDSLILEVANLISKGKIVGWFQDRMEFGPRALGNRSILGDPRSENMQKILNLKIKYRESFRPFAPAIISEDCSQYFDLTEDSPYMLIVTDVLKDRIVKNNSINKNLSVTDRINLKRSDIPAVTHVDYSARVQTVTKNSNEKFYALIKEFKKITGCSLLVNTSFNVRDEPIVCSPEDAYKCFMGTEMDGLAIGNFLLRKINQ